MLGIITRATLIICLVAFSACAGFKHRMYVPPESGEVAFIKILDSEGMPLKQYLASVVTYAEAENCKGRFFIQHYLYPGPTDYTRISAGKTFPLTAIVGEGNSYCTPGIKFVPEAGRYYEVRYYPIDSNDMCHLSLESSDSPSMSHARLEHPNGMNYTRSAFDENGSFCDP